MLRGASLRGSVLAGLIAYGVVFAAIGRWLARRKIVGSSS